MTSEQFSELMVVLNRIADGLESLNKETYTIVQHSTPGSSFSEWI